MKCSRCGKGLDKRDTIANGNVKCYWCGTEQSFTSNYLDAIYEACDVTAGNSLPLNPHDGMVFHNVDTNEVSYYDGTRWLLVYDSNGKKAEDKS